MTCGRQEPSQVRLQISTDFSGSLVRLPQGLIWSSVSTHGPLQLMIQALSESYRIPTHPVIKHGTSHQFHENGKFVQCIMLALNLEFVKQKVQFSLCSLKVYTITLQLKCSQLKRLRLCSLHSIYIKEAEVNPNLYYFHDIQSYSTRYISLVQLHCITYIMCYIIYEVFLNIMAHIKEQKSISCISDKSL